MRHLLKIFCAFLLVLSLAGCKTVYRMRGPIEKKIDAEALVDVILRYSVELKYDMRLHMQNSKIYYNEKVEGIRLDFSSQDIIELCEARGVLVDVVQGLLEKLNSNPSTASETAKGHFTARDLEIYIHYESDFVDYVDTIYVGWIRLKDGMSVFYSADINNFKLDFWHSRMEPYYKTLQYVRTTRDAETEYELSHPKKKKDSIFGEDTFAPTDWLSNGKSSRGGSRR